MTKKVTGWYYLNQPTDPINDLVVDILLDARDKFLEIQKHEVRVKGDNPVTADLILYLTIYIGLMEKRKRKKYARRFAAKKHTYITDPLYD